MPEDLGIAGTVTFVAIVLVVVLGYAFGRIAVFKMTAGPRKR